VTLTAVELRIGKQSDKVCSVAWFDVIALQVKRDVPKGLGIPVNVQSASRRRRILALLLGIFDLAEEVLAEV
jgi:hypothetical protein